MDRVSGLPVAEARSEYSNPFTCGVEQHQTVLSRPGEYWKTLSPYGPSRSVKGATVHTVHVLAVRLILYREALPTRACSRLLGIATTPSAWREAKHWIRGLLRNDRPHQVLLIMWHDENFLRVELKWEFIREACLPPIARGGVI